MEALDLALGLGVAGRAVLLADAEVREQVLQTVAAAGEARRIHRPVVGERGRGPAPGVAGRGEGRHHVVTADPPEHGAPQQVPRVVVEPGADLHPAPVGEAPVGEVRLPDLVGRGGLEADPGAPRAACAARGRRARRRGGPAGSSTPPGPAGPRARGARRWWPVRRRVRSRRAPSGGRRSGRGRRRMFPAGWCAAAGTAAPDRQGRRHGTAAGDGAGARG